jgi:hypothetical protein
VLYTFDESLARFLRFLKDQDRPQNVVWVTRNDVVISPKRKIYVKIPVPQLNEKRVRELFDVPLGVRRRVLFEVVCRSRDTTFARAWTPKNAGEANDRQMNDDLILSVRTGMSDVPGVVVKTELRWKYLQRKFRDREKLKDILFEVKSLNVSVEGGRLDLS